jgi:hypothetical protein
MCFCYAVASEPSRQRGIDGRLAGKGERAPSRVRRIDGGRIPSNNVRHLPTYPAAAKARATLINLDFVDIF